MNRVVFDASALLISINQEPGHQAVAAIADAIVMSSVNLAEVVTKLALQGSPASVIEAIVDAYHVDVVAFDRLGAMLTGSLVQKTRQLGLSLADRACLALGMILKLPVVTADRAWGRLDLDLDIRVVR
jgi:PIN domain nuclease of toxin-antitoxin system